MDAVYARRRRCPAPAALLAIYGFSVQIYCDFSGYTDMAIGLALMLGVRLPNNFLRPVHGATRSSTSGAAGTSRCRTGCATISTFRSAAAAAAALSETRNVIVTMVLGGLWHGANWTFVIWGLLHGIGVACRPRASSGCWTSHATLPRWLGVLITFHFVTLAWVFFRAPIVAKAAQMLRAPVTGGGWGDACAFAGAQRCSCSS